MTAHLELRHIVKSYGATVKTPVLYDISLQFAKGEFSAIIGQSGSGKTTLLNMIGVLDNPDSGETFFNGKNLYDLGDDELAGFRNANIGFVFQFHHLLPEFTALENVLIPWKIMHGRADARAMKKAEVLLDRVGVTEWKNNRSNRMSGGQQQRVAIARALMNDPPLVLADEPTGNLDSDVSESILKLLREINRELQTTFVIVTHDRHIAASCDRVIEIADGRILNDIKVDPQKADENWDRLAPCFCRMRKNAGDRTPV